MKGQTTDRLALHEALWNKADRFGKIEVYQTALAEELHVTKATMSLVIKDLVEAGRIKKISAKKGNIGVYQVEDPMKFEHVFVPVDTGIGVERCLTCGDLQEVGNHV